jgi:hypothetical protein
LRRRAARHSWHGPDPRLAGSRAPTRPSPHPSTRQPRSCKVWALVNAASHRPRRRHAYRTAWLPGSAPSGRCATARWRGAWGASGCGGGVDCVPCPRGRAGWRRPAGTGRRWTAAAASSSAPPSRPCRPPNPRTARTRSTVLRDRDHRRAVLEPRVPRTYPVFVADPDRVHHDDPPSRAGVVAVSVSLRHQRSSVTTHRPRLASSRRATGRTSSPFRTTARCPPNRDR